MKPWATGFYKSKAWKDTREAYAKSRGYLCERCLSHGIVKPGEIVHHKIFLNEQNIRDPNISLNWSNLELVCRECHAEIHEQNRRRYKIDAAGHVSSRGL